MNKKCGKNHFLPHDICSVVVVPCIVACFSIRTHLILVSYHSIASSDIKSDGIGVQEVIEEKRNQLWVNRAYENKKPAYIHQVEWYQKQQLFVQTHFIGLVRKLFKKC